MPEKAPHKKIRGLYAVIDTVYVKPGDVQKVALELMSGGARIIQLRAKGRGSGEVLGMAKALKAVTEKRGVTFIVNDRVDVALMCGAEGVHLGQEDIPVEEARRLLGIYAVIGLSTHSLEEAMDADKTSADYISFGPVFPTGTKKDARPAKGVEALREVVRLSKKPVVAIGGITEERLEEVLDAGADSVAMISGILLSDDIAAKVSSIAAGIKKFI